MSCCTNTYNLGCFNNCSIIAVGLCLTSGTYNGVFTYGNISTTITVTAIENEPFLFDLSLLNENATFTLAIYDENENQITLTIDSVDYDCFKVKTQVDSVKVTQGTIIGCTPMCKEIYDPNDENTAVLFTVAVDGTTITGDGTAGNPLIAIGGGGGGGIESIVAGDNITVDNTDPLNPIVSASGGGSSALFPNGIEFVNESRDFRASDAGKRLFVSGENAVISMPEVNPFAVGDYVGIINNGDNIISFTTEYGGEPIFSLKTGDGTTSECVILMNTEIEGSSWLFPISTSFKYDETDSKNKTALKYLYDKVQSMGSSALFPNGIKDVTESRDLQADDAGYILLLQATDEFTPTILNIAYPSPLENGQVFAVVNQQDISGQNNAYYDAGAGGNIKLAPSEFKIFTTTFVGDDNVSIPTNEAYLGESPIEKTALRYLYDKSQNAIPLSGTEVGKPVTGDIYFNDATSLVLNDGGGGASFRVGYSGVNTFLTFQTGSGLDYIGVNSDGVGASRGLVGGADYSANITDLDYTQKIYVDSLATSKQDALVSGTNIKTINGSSILGSGDMTVGGQVDILQIQMFI